MIFKAMTLNEFIREIRKILKTEENSQGLGDGRKGSRTFKKLGINKGIGGIMGDLQFWREMGQIREAISE